MNDKITIGITHADIRNENYAAWMKDRDNNIEIIDLSMDKENWEQIEDCDGIVLSGGVDIHPRFYNNNRTDYPNAPENGFNQARDEFEMHVFEAALNFYQPVLAICRGMQLVNVALGGDLIQDLQEAGKHDHRRAGDSDREHIITVHQKTLLNEVTGELAGNINSSHHQAVGHLSDELMASAISPDGVIEGIEWKEKAGEPWMLCVQWHPERMNDGEVNPFSKNIREQFLAAVKKRKNESRQPSH